ncbi:MAG TPA: Gfo/Idh/MocA family oxidoreductase [Candidatus Limnocylindria bacterium]|nr:Gfo/Idh/MocA family oxidoreductase [Candidatus Limnocylindria bacterium]
MSSARDGRRLRAGVVGAGMMGRNHVRVYDELLPDVDLVAVADPDPGALERATDGRPARGYRHAERMLAEEALDLVSIVAPTSLHRVTALAALAAGAHVLVEKPIAADRGEAEEMIAAARDAGRLLTVGHIERFNPAVRELRRRLAEGELGRLFALKATRLGPFPARIRDVGVVVDLATHDIDIARYLLGCDPVRLFAETERRIHTDHEDLFVGTLKFENGVLALLDINWLTPTKHRTLSVTGERGMFTVDYLRQDLVFFANPAAVEVFDDGAAEAGAPRVAAVSEGEMRRLPVARAEPLAVELAEFAGAARAGGRPPVDPHDALVALLLATKMVESAERGIALSGAELAEALA